MKTILSFVIFIFFVLPCKGQVFTTENIFDFFSLSPSRFDSHLSEKGFAFTGKDARNDTILRLYDYRRTRNFKNIDSITRSMIRADGKDMSSITYETGSRAEYLNIRAQLKKAGFYCNQEQGGDSLPSLLYQQKDLSVRTLIKTEDSVTRYSLQFQRKTFPGNKDIYYANDLLTFTSHEYLVYYFGEKNVKKDIYFLSGNEIAKCSVLFLNTNRQVVFIWSDQDNRCSISSLLFGGQLNLQSSLETGKYVAENNWMLKSGVRPGMSLMQLRMLNGNDFSFYGGNSANSGSIIPDNNGKLDFKKEEIVLGCLNCNDDKFTTAKKMNADDSIQEGRILFVLSVVLNPLLN
ncbi:MAG: hypothetical protein ABIQ31_06230 [Ferruginibacter sp.]